MSEFDTTFERLIELMIDKRVPFSVSPGVVSDIDKTNDICTVELDEGQKLYEVRLRSVIDGDENKLVVYPKDKSTVLTILIENDIREAFVLACSNVESVALSIGDKSLKADKDGFVFNDGVDGIIKLPYILSWMQNVHTDLVALQQLLLISPIAGGGAAAAIQFTPITKEPDKEKLEDITIKH